MDKGANGLVFHICHDHAQYCFEVDTHAGTYSDVLFPEIERLSEGWTRYDVEPWMLMQIGGDEWGLYRTFEQWRNRPTLDQSPETYIRLLIQLNKERYDEEYLQVHEGG